MKRKILYEEGIILLVDSFYYKIRGTFGLKEVFEQIIGLEDESWNIQKDLLILPNTAK